MTFSGVFYLRDLHLGPIKRSRMEGQLVSWKYRSSFQLKGSMLQWVYPGDLTDDQDRKPLGRIPLLALLVKMRNHFAFSRMKKKQSSFTNRTSV